MPRDHQSSTHSPRLYINYVPPIKFLIYFSGNLGTGCAFLKNKTKKISWSLILLFLQFRPDEHKGTFLWFVQIRCLEIWSGLLTKHSNSRQSQKLVAGDHLILTRYQVFTLKMSYIHLESSFDFTVLVSAPWIMPVSLSSPVYAGLVICNTYCCITL